MKTLKLVMKTLKCDLCDAEASGETFDQWMKALQPHYMEAHAGVMSGGGRSKEDMEKDRARWTAENKARFEAAPER